MEAKWPLMGTDFGQFETSPLEFRRSLITKFNNQNKNKKIVSVYSKFRLRKEYLGGSSSIILCLSP